MPCITGEADKAKKGGGSTTTTRHREKIGRKIVPFSACVARPVGRKDMTANPKASAAMQAEWAKLIKKGMWSFATVRDKFVVVAETRKKGERPSTFPIATSLTLQGPEAPSLSVVLKVAMQPLRQTIHYMIEMIPAKDPNDDHILE